MPGAVRYGARPRRTRDTPTVGLPTLREDGVDAAIERDVMMRLRRIETQLQLISEHLGLPWEDRAGASPPSVVELVRAGQRAQAMQEYMRLTGASLRDAQVVVSRL